MKILHTADLHFDNNPAFLRDIVKCCNYLLSHHAKEEKPDVIVVAGDTFNQGSILGSPATIEAINFVMGCAEIAPVLIVKGTLSHDSPPDCLDVFQNLKCSNPVYVAKAIEQIALTKNGFAQLTTENIADAKAIFSCLPSVSKSNFVANGNGDNAIAKTNYEIAELLRDIFQGWGVANKIANSMGIPTILCGHGTVTGAEASTGQKIIGRDIEFSLNDLALAKARLVALGHIHKQQSWNLGEELNVCYCGSITRNDYAETEDKGFYLHEWDGERFASNFVKTPARVMRTIAYEGLPTIDRLDEINEGDEVRIVYTVNQEDAAKIDEAELERVAREKGAASFKINKTVVPIVRSRSEGISKLKTLEEKLLSWGEAANVEITESVIDKLRLVETHDADEIIATYKNENSMEVANAA